MAISKDGGSNPVKITYNNKDVSEVYYNGTHVWPDGGIEYLYKFTSKDNIMGTALSYPVQLYPEWPDVFMFKWTPLNYWPKPPHGQWPDKTIPSKKVNTSDTETFHIIPDYEYVMEFTDNQGGLVTDPKSPFKTYCYENSSGDWVSTQLSVYINDTLIGVVTQKVPSETDFGYISVRWSTISNDPPYTGKTDPNDRKWHIISRSGLSMDINKTMRSINKVIYSFNVETSYLKIYGVED